MRAKALVPGAALLLLAACGKSGDSTPAPIPPADAPPPSATDFSRPLNALGADPFWSVKIRPEGLTFSTTGAKDVAAPNPGPKIDADQAAWSANGGDGKPISILIKARVCQDGTSGLTYPFTATVDAGGRRLNGCAAYADAMPKEGG